MSTRPKNPGSKPQPSRDSEARRAPISKREGSESKAKSGSDSERPEPAEESRNWGGHEGDDAEGPIRLSKRMADLGLCSRREADRFISMGQVKVDGVIVDVLGSKVTKDQEIELLSEARDELESKLTIALHKPVGYVSSQPEDGHKSAVELLSLENYHGRCPKLPRDFWRGLAPAGRLDIDSKGLLILTQDGVVARKFIHHDSDEEKEYIVRVEGDITREKLKYLSFGLELDDRPLKRAKVEILEPQVLKVILKEGRKRQIRRMCELLDLEVTSLKRVRIGNIKLGDLPMGMWRILKKYELP